jgi:hypothetical protein
MEGASMQILRAVDMETEFSRFQNHIKEKAPHTIKSYLQNYKKVRDKVGKELCDVPLEDLVLEIGQMSDSYASQKAYANVWSICNFQMCGKETHPAYIKYYTYLEGKIEEQLRAKHKQIKDDVIPMADLIKHEDKLYKDEQFQKYVACFIVRNCCCRNKDLDITVTNIPESVNDKDNFLVVYDNKVVVIRQDYKTAKVHGKIETIFKDKKFINACNKLSMNKKLFIGADTTAKLQNRLKNALFTNEVQYLNTKIDEISRTGDLKELKRVSELRGTGIDHLVTAYNLDF